VRGRPEGGCRRAAVWVVLTVAALSPVLAGAAEPIKPAYLPFAEFSPEDTREQIAARRDYNLAIRAYNQALYEYHVTLERHDRLVEVYNAATTDPAERKRAREEAERLRFTMGQLGQDIQARASQVDQAWRRAADTGLTIRR
jgi:hypothetical protein